MRSKFEVGGHLGPSVGLEIMQVHRLGVRAQEGDIRTWRIARGNQIQGQLGWGWSPLFLAELALGTQGGQDGRAGAEAVATTASLQLLDTGQDLPLLPPLLKVDEIPL